MLQFLQVYHLTNNGYLNAAIIALGVRAYTDKHPDTGKVVKGIEFLTAGEYGHRISGKLVEAGEGVFTIRDEERTVDGKKPVVWKFEPLTMELWTKMGESGGISGFDKLRTQIGDRGTLVNFYVSNFLHDYWTETPEKT